LEREASLDPRDLQVSTVTMDLTASKAETDGMVTRVEMDILEFEELTDSGVKEEIPDREEKMDCQA